MTGTASDGSPVELYARMPTFGEPELVHDAIPAGAEILELGAGAGRMTHRLVELGHRVTAVDSSEAMLAHVRAAETVHAPIEELDLGRRFGCVLLASQLINVDDDEERAAFLATCVRHVADDGVVLLQRYDPAWAADPAPSEATRDGVTFRVVDARREGERLHATVEYELDGQRWRHGPFVSRILADAELEARLGVAGLRLDRWLDDRRTWLAASLAPDLSALYLPIPAADPAIGSERARWDPAGLAVTAHVTVLFPFLPPTAIDAAVDAALAEIAAAMPVFELRFDEVGRFPSVTWLAPRPVEALRALTDAVAMRWPDHPPYGGVFDEVVHHLTVADGAPPDVHARLEASLPARLPIVQRVDRLTLSVRERGTWSIRRQYSLGGDARRDGRP